MSEEKAFTELSLADKNAEVRRRVELGTDKFYEGALNKIDKASRNFVNEGIQPLVFEKMKEGLKKHLSFIKDAAYKASEYHEVRVDGEVRHTQYCTVIHEATSDAFNKFEKMIADDIRNSNIPGLSKTEVERQLKAAQKAVYRELPKPGLMSTLTSAFYDEDKESFRWGGILGFLGGMAASTMIGGGAEGGLLSVAIMLVIAAAGAWLGNLFGDAYSSKNDPAPKVSGPQQAIEPKQARGVVLASGVDPARVVNLELSDKKLPVNTDVFFDKDNKKTTPSRDNIQKLMGITLTPVEGSNLVTVSEVAILGKKDGKDEAAVIKPSQLNLKIQNDGANKSVYLSEELINAELLNSWREALITQAKKDGIELDKEQFKSLTPVLDPAKIISLNQSGETKAYLDKDNKIVVIPVGNPPSNVTELMQVTLNPIAGSKDQVAISEVAVLGEKNAEGKYDLVKLTPTSPQVNITIQNNGKDNYIYTGDELVQSKINGLRDQVFNLREEERKKLTPDQQSNLDQSSKPGDLKTEKKINIGFGEEFERLSGLKYQPTDVSNEQSGTLPSQSLRNQTSEATIQGVGK